MFIKNVYSKTNLNMNSQNVKCRLKLELFFEDFSEFLDLDNSMYILLCFLGYRNKTPNYYKLYHIFKIELE